MARSPSSFNHTWLRLPLAGIVSLVMLVALGGSAAAGPPTIIREASTFAAAFATDCVAEPDGSEVCTTLALQVIALEANWEVCTFHDSIVTPPGGDPVITEEDGCSVVPLEAYSVSRSLTSATLEPVTVTVESTVCDESGCTDISRNVTVSATWDGKRNLLRFNDKDTIVFGDCVVVFRDKDVLREVAATLNYGGQTYVTGDAILSRSRDRTKISSGCG